MATQAYPSSAGRRPSSERQSNPSAASASNLTSSSFQHRPRAHDDGSSTTSSGGGAVNFMLRALYEKLPTTQYRPLAVLRADPAFGRPLEALQRLSEAKPNDVLRPLLVQAAQAGQELPFLARDDLTFSPAHQAFLFLLELIHFVLPAPPSTPEDDPLPSFKLDGRTADRLLSLAGGILVQHLPSSSSRTSEGTSVRNASGSIKGVYRKPKRQHERVSSRSGALSPSISSLSVGAGGSLRGATIHPNASVNSTRSSADSASSLPFSALSFNIHTSITETAAGLVRSLSYFRWEAYFAALQARAQHLASESNIATNPSAQDLTELVTLGACFIDRTRLNQVLQALSSVFLHIPRVAQAILAESVYQNIWSFIKYSPDEFVELHRGAGLQGDLSSLFDMAWNSSQDLGVATAKWANNFWPAMALWIALSPSMCSKVVEHDGDGRRQIKGSAAKKVEWFQTVQNSFYLSSFAQVAKRCCIDLVYLSTLLPSKEDYGLKILVSDFVVELQEQLLIGEDVHRDTELLSFGFYSLIRRNPRDVLLSSLPGFKSTMIDWQKYTMTKALLKLQKEMPGVFFDGDPLFADVGSVLRDFVRDLQPEPSSLHSLLPHDKIATLSSINLELLQLVLEFFVRDVRFLIPNGSSQVAIDVELGGILKGLSSILSAPVPSDLKVSAASCLASIYEAVAQIELGSGAEDVWRVLGNAAWTPLWYAGLPIFKPSLAEDSTLAASFAILSDMFDLACKYSVKFSWYLASQSAIGDGLDMHEAASICLALSPDPLLRVAGLRSLQARTGRLQEVISALSEKERELSPGRELKAAAEAWSVTSDLQTVQGLRKILHSTRRSLKPRTAEIVLEESLSRWREAAEDMDIMPFESPEVEQWRHAAGFIGSYLGCLLADEPFRLPSGSSADLAREFIDGLTGFLCHPDAQIRSSVSETIGLLDPSLAPAIVRSLYEASKGLFDDERAPVRQPVLAEFVSLAAVALASLLRQNAPPVVARDPPPMNGLCINFIDYLASISADFSSHAHTPVALPYAKQYIEAVTHVCSMLEACVIAQHRLGSSEDDQRQLASVALDALSNWTSASLIGFSRSAAASDVRNLDMSCLQAAAACVTGPLLVDEHRAGRSRRHLAEKWVDVTLSLADAADTDLPAWEEQQTMLVHFLAGLLRSNGNVVLQPLLAAARSEVASRRALALAALGEVTEDGGWLKKDVINGTSARPAQPLLRLLNGHQGITLSPSILYFISGSSTDNDALAELLLRQSEANGRLFAVLEILCQVEVANTNGEADIFRGATLTTKVFTLLAKRHGLNYFRTILKPFIVAVCEGHPSRFESEIRSSSSLSSESPSTRSLEILAQTCFDRICDSVDEAPPILKEACRILGESFEKKFKGLRRRAVSSFIVLRVISPAMISPSSIHIHHPNLSGGGRRALVEISKLLVHLANDASLGKAVATEEFANFLTQRNLASMVTYLDALQTSTTPAVLTPSSASDDSADEFFLRLYLSSNYTALQNAPKGSLLEEKIDSILNSPSPRSTMTLGRIFRPEHLTSDYRVRASIEFAKRCSTMQQPRRELVHDISTRGKNIYAVDFSGVFDGELDIFLHAALQSVRDSLRAFTLVLDCSTLSATSSATQENLGNWIFAALQVLPDGITSLCRKVVLWCPSSWTIKTFRRMHAMLSLFDNHRRLNTVVGCSSGAALAHQLDIPEEEIMLPSLMDDEEPIFIDDKAEVVDVHGQRRPVVLSLNSTSLLLRHVKLESLSSQHGHTQLAVKDVYGLQGLERFETLEAATDESTLRLFFSHNLVLDIVTHNPSKLMATLDARRSKALSPLVNAEQTIVRLFFVGLSSLFVRDDAVRRIAFNLLDRLVSSDLISCPDLQALRGFRLPAAVHDEVAILVDQVARCNPQLAPSFLHELCTIIGASYERGSTPLLSFVGPFLRVVASISTTTTPGGLKGLRKRAICDLVSMTVDVSSVHSIDERILRLWEGVGKFDHLFIELASEQLLVRLNVGNKEDAAVISEVMTSLSSAATLASTVSAFRQDESIPEVTNRGLKEALSEGHAQTLQLLVKLSYCRRQPAHMVTLLPELLATCLRVIATGGQKELDTALSIVTNAFHSLADPFKANEMQKELDNLGSIARTPLSISDDGVLLQDLLGRVESLARSLHSLLRVVSPNNDQYNVWITRWIALASRSTASTNEAAAVSALATLIVFLDVRTPDSDFVQHVLGQLAKELEHASRPHIVLGLVRILTTLVEGLPAESATGLFWIGLAVTKISSIYFAAGVQLVAAALQALALRGLVPAPTQLCAFLEQPRCAFLLDQLEDDWGVRFGSDGSFTLGILAMLFKGLLSPSTLAPTREALLVILSLLLQSHQIQPVEELTFLVAMSAVEWGREVCEEAFATVGRTLENVEQLVIQEGKLSLACLAFIAGPCIDGVSTEALKTLPFSILAGAMHTAPTSLAASHDLLLPQLEETFSHSTDGRNLELASVLYPFVATSAGGAGSSLDRLPRTLSSLGLPYLHMCHNTAEPRKEASRRLSFIAAVLVKAEAARFLDSEEL